MGDIPPPTNTGRGRHPLGRSCQVGLLPALLLMPYALARYGWDAWRKRGAR